ncbi:ankyrin repeat domain-containing protein [Aeromicrobium sp. P5_D10]
MTNLDQAVRREDLSDVVELLRSGADVNQALADGLTALMVASARGNAQLVAILLTAGADPLRVERQMGATALHKAAQGGNGDVVSLLLDHGAFIDQQSPSLGNTALMDAVLQKQPEAVRVLLRRGARTDVMNHWHQTAAELAHEDGREAIAGLIRDHDATNARTVASLSLFAAAKAGDLATVEQLIAGGAVLNERHPIVGGFDDDYTPLGVATREGHVDVVELLLAAGADPRRTIGLMRGTAVHDAAYFGLDDVLRCLLSPRPSAPTADIDAQGPYNGLTALHDAVWHGHTASAQVLLEAGASLSLRTHAGLTPKDLASLYGYEELVDLLAAEELRRGGSA